MAWHWDVDGVLGDISCTVAIVASDGVDAVCLMMYDVAGFELYLLRRRLLKPGFTLSFLASQRTTNCEFNIHSFQHNTHHTKHTTQYINKSSGYFKPTTPPPQYQPA
jgi:hypothetical protein